ncbi:ribosomal protein S18 acetylase RimI-like enzyme [Bacillus mesophilus]|uniref:GNAT family N-acetyltransferase n=1 Tax=Bacillus mesophilus TaxID=1808955 RepID=A0A6M0Q573_9BACI|nr:GNAT family N-acetyltransferase [Bacillus mesophilus]MBM7661073.1 ribosomal protein S18 acetylase RimI-like enzyme [Bacillus mesophilus]NEY71393.1 GNAT family N-acetyltransferase [Bacillus mesophilus]
MHIRRAEIEDAKGIARVHVDSWRTTYKNIIPDEFLSSLSYEQRTDLWQRNISKGNNFVFVAENTNGEIVGFADCGRRENNDVYNSGDLTSIYLLEEFQGQGIGKRLMKQLFLQFQELDYEKVFVEVIEDNKTRSFYEYYGAKLLRSERIKIAGTELELLIYQWDNAKEVVI